MMHSVADVAGINWISERILANAAHALVGMIAHASPEEARRKPAVGLTMFGVTTPCVLAVTRALADRYECLVFHATGTGGQAMEHLVGLGLLSAVIDVTTTEIADELVGGVFSAGPDRLDAIIHRRIPYVGSCGALDMVNFHGAETVPARFRGRKLHQHNPNVTLMRTSPEECDAIGAFLASKLNRMEGPVRFLLPEGGLSVLDFPGSPWHDPAADRALFDAIVRDFLPGARPDPAAAPARHQRRGLCPRACRGISERLRARGAALQRRCSLLTGGPRAGKVAVDEHSSSARNQRRAARGWPGPPLLAGALLLACEDSPRAGGRDRSKDSATCRGVPERKAAGLRRAELPRAGRLR